MENLIEKMKEFGFNSYESKVYLALLKKNPSTGYEISQLADIPQSRAYDALKSLEAENIVYTFGNDRPLKYSPISPKELTKRLKRKMNSSIDFLEKKLPHVKSDDVEPVNRIFGYENITNKIKEIVDNTYKTLYLGVWAYDYKVVEEVISNAYDRGVEIKISGFDNLKTMYGDLYPHQDTIEKEDYSGGRLIYLLSDNKECLFLFIEDSVIWTNDKNISFLIKEFFIHDMCLIDIQEKFPEQLKYFYGTGLKKLKNKISDKKSVYKE